MGASPCLQFSRLSHLLSQSLFKKRQDKLKAQWTHVVGIASTYFARLRYFFPQTFTHCIPPPFHEIFSFCQCATAAGVLPLSPQNRCFFYGLWQKFEPAKIQGWENSGSTTCCYSAVSDLRIDKQNLQYKVSSNSAEVTFSVFKMKKLPMHNSN